VRGTKHSGPRVTVIIPAYRADRTIGRALDSALGQCGGNINVIVVIDDGSEQVRQLIESRSDPRVRTLMNEMNLGAPASRNRGLTVATTPLVAFLDADDFYEGDLLEPLAKAMEEENTPLGFGPSKYWNERHGYTYSFIPDYRNHEDLFIRWFSGIRSVNTCSVLWASPYLREIGGWDEQIQRNQDGEVALRAILLGAPFSMSAEGAGVWFNDVRIPSITTRTDNLALLLHVVDKFLKMRSDEVSDTARLEGCAGQLHYIAHVAYRVGQDTVGDKAMRLRRSIGYRDQDGVPKYILSVSLRAFPRSLRLFAWRAARSLKDFYLGMRVHAGLARRGGMAQ
jgi:glycosyltransferase involved in cell wall biosynthesis